MRTRIYRDDHGIPHVWADDPLATIRGQGEVTARDRAWQLEVERRRAHGVSAAFLGPDHLAWDCLVRRVRLVDTARRCYDALDADTAAWVRAYVDGVNAALPEAAQNAPENAPQNAPEFAQLGVAPEPWDPWDPLAIWLSHHLLFSGFPATLWRDRVAATLGEDAVAAFAADQGTGSGSNGWLLDGDRTATGVPLVAGDPHRFIEAPGLYQQIRLACPAYDVLGFAVPGVPGIGHFGHAGSVAWGITNAMADYQDLYRERLRLDPARPDDPDAVQAWSPHGWEQVAAHHEQVQVRGQDPVTVQVIETPRGPVILGGPASPDEQHDEQADELADEQADPGTQGRWAALSLRTPTRVREALGFEALPRLLAARTVADVDAAMDAWVEPVNVVLAADDSGATLHRVAGAVPRRAARSRLGVSDAWDCTAAWSGWEEMPYARVEGQAVMANERALAADLGVEFSAPHRADRIVELLASRPRWTAGDQREVHRDTLLLSAEVLRERLIAPLSPASGLTDRAADLQATLLAWDGRMDADSHPAAVFAAWRGALARRIADDPALAALRPRPDDPEIVRPWLSLLARVGYALESLTTPAAPTAPGAPDAPYALPGLPEIDVLAHSRAALEEIAGADLPTTWGEVHRLALWQAVPGSWPQDPPLDGDHDCVRCSSSVFGLTDRSARSSAARYVWDLARREDSGWVVPLGSSGVPGSAHAADQLPTWLRGELVGVVTDWRLLTEDDSEGTRDA